MDYSEDPPPPELRHLVKLRWRLSVPRGPGKWSTHVATPDGCMEVIRRIEGRSRWGAEQPERFVVGVIGRPAELRLGAGSRFVGLRIWPWTWSALTGRSPAELSDRWVALPNGLPARDDGLPAVAADLLSADDRRIAESVLAAHGAGDIASRAGVGARRLQRWYERHVGMPPRSYLRLLRFSDAFASLPESRSSLAQHALEHGFADQAHMAREFRSLAGSPAAAARPRARGPFIERPFGNRG